MAPAIESAEPLRPYVVRVVFADGEVRDVDVEPLLEFGVFRALRDPDFFNRVAIGEFHDTIEWPNGADIDPEVLYGVAKAIEPGPRISTPQRA
jgi:hypothetical protein